MNALEKVQIPTGKDLIHFDNAKVELIRKTVANSLDACEFELFMAVARARGLDPVLNQIHAVKRRDGDSGSFRMVIQVGIDGGRLIAARTADYAGSDAAVYTFFENGNIESASVTVYRIVQGHRVGFTGTAYWDEYYPTNEKQGFMWRKMPRSQLAKCAEMQALRKGFPNDLSGFFAPEELERDVNAPIEKPASVLAPVDDEWKAKTALLFSRFAKAFVKPQMILAKYGIKESWELTREQFDELRDIGPIILKDSKKIPEYFGGKASA